MAYFGQSPTFYLTSNGAPVEAKGNRSFSRVGAYGWWFIKDLDVETFYMHGQDNVYLGNKVAANNPGACPQVPSDLLGTAVLSRHTTR